jgi:hypothetical protein
MSFKQNQSLKILLLLLLPLLLFTTVLAQNQTNVVELKSTNCEIDEANFSVVENAAKETPNGNGFLIVIARLGDRDKRHNLNQSRLNVTKEYLVGKLRYPANKLVMAEGEKVRGNGRVEFYINGILTHVILPKPNLSLCTECCNPPDVIVRRKLRKKQR